MKNRFKLLSSIFVIYALFLAASAEAQGGIVNKVRLGQHGQMTRVVLESDKPLKPHHFTLPTPPRFVIDFPEIQFKKKLADVALPKGGLVNGLRQGHFRPGVVRMVVDLKKASVASVFTIPASKNKGYRLVIDLKPATNAQIASRKKEILKKQAAIANKRKTAKSSVSKPKAHISKKKQGEFVIVIDPGHGGVDPGAVSRKRLYEKNVVLQVAKKLQKELGKRKNVKVYLTRSRDIFLPLKERVAFAQRKDADLFISLHADAHRNRKVRGGSVYVLSDKASDKEAARLARHANDGDMVAGINLSEESKDVRDILIDLTQRETMNKSAQLAKEILGQIGGVVKLRKKNILFAGFRVLKAPEIPSILVEMSYISNPRDEKILKSGKKQTVLAQKIARGVDRYIQKHVHN